MAWFSRRKPQGEYPEEVGLATGAYRSPGLVALAEELEGRTVEAILDLGCSSPENLAFMSRYSGNIVIRDLASAGGSNADAPRASLFQIGSGCLDAEDDRSYDVLLVWDILHYVAPDERETFAHRLVRLSRPGALMLVHASGSTSIPLSPVRFKIRDAKSLSYEVHGERRKPSPQFTPRSVEKLMRGFRPLRFFQLRNGLQEFLLQKNEEAKSEAVTDKEAAKPAARPEPGLPKPRQPGDWY